MVATLFGAGQLQVFAQGVEQGGAGVEVHGLRSAVHLDRHLGLDRAGGIGGAGLCANERRQRHAGGSHGAYNQKGASGNRHQSIPLQVLGEQRTVALLQPS
ncbi:hypothetical protein D3C81_1379630 [compost metagenome]